MNAEIQKRKLKMTRTYKVWSLDIWGHGSDECCKSYDCPCVTCPEDCEGECETGETHDECVCDCGFQVNDRCQVGAIECQVTVRKHNPGTNFSFDSETVDDREILRVLKEDGFVKESVSLGDVEFDSGDEYSIYLNDAKNGRPVFQLEWDEEEENK